MKRGLALLLAAILTIPLATTVSAKTWTLKYGHVDSPTMTADDHVGGLFLKNFIESRSQGRIKV